MRGSSSTLDWDVGNSYPTSTPGGKLLISCLSPLFFSLKNHLSGLVVIDSAHKFQSELSPYTITIVQLSCMGTSLHYSYHEMEILWGVWVLGSDRYPFCSLFGFNSPARCFKDWPWGVSAVPVLFIPYRCLDSVGLPRISLCYLFTLHHRTYLGPCLFVVIHLWFLFASFRPEMSRHYIVKSKYSILFTWHNHSHYTL